MLSACCRKGPGAGICQGAGGCPPPLPHLGSLCCPPLPSHDQAHLLHPPWDWSLTPFALFGPHTLALALPLAPRLLFVPARGGLTAAVRWALRAVSGREALSQLQLQDLGPGHLASTLVGSALTRWEALEDLSRDDRTGVRACLQKFSPVDWPLNRVVICDGCVGSL